MIVPIIPRGSAENDRHRPRPARTSKPVGRRMTAQILRDGASWRRHQIGARRWRKLEKCVLQATVDLQFGQLDNGGVPVEIEDRQSFDQEAFLVNRQDHALEGEILSFRGKVQEMLPTFPGSSVEDLTDSEISPEAANPKEDPDR